MPTVSIRAYERKDLPLEERLSSLALRFSSMKNAEGISPFSAEILHQWIQKNSNTATIQTGLLLLHLAEFKTAEPFDVLSAMAAWDENDQQMFINFLRIWDF